MDASSSDIPDDGTRGHGASLRIPIGLVIDLGNARSQDETLDAFATWAHLVVKSDRCSVALPEDDALVVTGLAGNRAIPTGTKVPIDSTFIGRVFATQQIDRLNDLSNRDYPDAISLSKAGMKTLMIAPLMAGGKCLGTLAFAFQEDCYDDLERLSVIEALAQCLATQLLVVDQLIELERLAETDPLTDAFNRRHYYEISDILWSTWKASHIEFSVASFDIDHFKSINDTYGHTAGDTVLKEVAARLRSAIRDGDAVVRMGGEEFLLVLRNCPAERAETVAARAHAAVSHRPIILGDAEISVTISAGVATVSKDDENLLDLTRRADKALYSAKKAGRDRIVISPGRT